MLLPLRSAGKGLLGCLIAPGLLALSSAARADLPAVTLPPAVVAGAPAAVVHPAPLTLDGARAAAVANQSAVAAAQASFSAAVIRRDAVYNLRVPTFLARDLPVRRNQADLGVQVAEAGVHLAQLNASYAAAYTYLSYLYALEQEKVAADAVENLTDLRGKLLGKEKDKKGRVPEPEDRIAQLHVETYLNVAKARRDEARLGAERALSGLREALGLAPDCPLTIARCVLPDLNLTLDKRILLDLACSRRPEITQAALGVEATSLEVKAQKRPGLLAFRVNTFAAGSDIHSNPLPAGSYDSDYKPGAVGPEMPVTINGGKHDRVAQAEALVGRAGTVLDKTKALIALETDQAFLRWVEASKRLAGYRPALRAAQQRAEEARALYEKAGEPELMRQLLDTGAVASQMRADVNKARYDMLLNLAQLERVTAGGFCAKIDSAPDRPDDVAAAKAEAAALIKKREADKKKGKGD